MDFRLIFSQNHGVGCVLGNADLFLRYRTLPFTVEQSLGVFEQYNQAIWPMQIVAYILGIAALVLVVKKTPYSDRAISVILAVFWAWVGIVYHLMYFSAINGAALGFGALFIVQAVLWLVFGVIRPKPSER